MNEHETDLICSLLCNGAGLDRYAVVPFLNWGKPAECWAWIHLEEQVSPTENVWFKQCNQVNISW